MAITFDDSSAPTTGAQTGVNDTTGSSCDLTTVADRQHLILTMSAKGYYRRSASGTWMLVPAEVPVPIYEVGGLDTLYYKADTGTITVYVAVLSPRATLEGRG